MVSVGKKHISAEDVIDKYTLYNTAYAEIISGWESVLRGIMHYKKVSDEVYVNTTLFTHGTDITLSTLRNKQKNISMKIDELTSLLYELRNDSNFSGYGISRFLERNIDKTISVFNLLSHATIWIEAEKSGYSVDKKHIASCHALTLLYYKTTLGNTISSQPKQVKSIHTYVRNLYHKTGNEGLSFMKTWLEDNNLLHGSKKTSSVPGEETLLSSGLCLSVVIFFVTAMLQVTKQHKKLYIVLSEDSVLRHDKKILALVNTGEIHIVSQTLGTNDDIFYIHVGRSGWRISKDTFFVPQSGLEISIMILCEIIDHELGTHAATNLADTALLNTRSYGYSKMEEGMAVFNQRMVTAGGIRDLKRIPTYHHVACYFAESLGFEALKNIMYDFFVLLGNTKRLAKKNAEMTALRAKRYVALSLPGANSHLLAYTDGYLYFLDMYAKSKAIEDNSFRLLWKWMHLGKFTTRDMQDIKPFLRLIHANTKEIPKPIYFGRYIYQSLYGNLTHDELIQKDKRYQWTGLPTPHEEKCLVELYKKIRKILNEAECL